ncbi:hypothetical protein HOY80DRAFT_333836 [Tuber brumale]|nr:hypothetical protein HOY80DRAFT_333836 [Tuber brumale]
MPFFFFFFWYARQGVSGVRMPVYCAMQCLYSRTSLSRMAKYGQNPKNLTRTADYPGQQIRFLVVQEIFRIQRISSGTTGDPGE